MEQLDPNLVLVLGALAAITKDTASQAVKDAYNSLKSLIGRKSAKKQNAEAVLTEYKNAPEQWEEPLKEMLLKSGALQDPEIIEAARKVLELANTQQAISKYNVQVAGPVQGLVQGDGVHVDMTFNEKPPNEDK